jgi:predicted FMN-binding regulatory protein PaiB
MYQPHVFREERLQTLHSLIRARPLATLITAGPGGLLANLVPFTLVDGGEKGILHAHIAKANDQVDALRSGAETLMVFQGPRRILRHRGTYRSENTAARSATRRHKRRNGQACGARW